MHKKQVLQVYADVFTSNPSPTYHYIYMIPVVSPNFDSQVKCLSFPEDLTEPLLKGCAEKACFLTDFLCRSRKLGARLGLRVQVRRYVQMK